VAAESEDSILCYSDLPMATRKKPPAKAAPELPFSVEPYVPITGDKVRYTGKDTVYVVSRVYRDGTEVDLSYPGTNFERYRVRITELEPLEPQAQRPARPAPPPRSRIDTAEVRERLESVAQSTVDHLSGEIAILKKYLRTKGAPTEALEILDTFCEEQEKAWKDTVTRVSKLLES
jgi:hypothetical protein